MLTKIMRIMNRKPLGNGLDGVPLKRQDTDPDYDQLADDASITFQGNADISLIQSNVEQQVMNSRFSFEISPSLP